MLYFMNIALHITVY